MRYLLILSILLSSLMLSAQDDDFQTSLFIEASGHVYDFSEGSYDGLALGAGFVTESSTGFIITAGMNYVQGVSLEQNYAMAYAGLIQRITSFFYMPIGFGYHKALHSDTGSLAIFAKPTVHLKNWEKGSLRFAGTITLSHSFVTWGAGVGYYF